MTNQMRSELLHGFFLLVLGIAIGFLSPSSAIAEEGDPMWRMYNRYTGEHFYTASIDERDSLRHAGWACEGVGWVAPESGQSVYRLYNSYVPGGDHHYTANAAERDSLVSVGWSYEGIGWYSGGDVRLLRQYNPYAVTGTHNYTTNPDENTMLVAAGWLSEGYAWSGIGAGYDVPGLGPIDPPAPSNPSVGSGSGSEQPSAPSTSVAYLVAGSSVYHTHWCRSMEGAKNYRTVTLAEAQASGRRLCKNCAQIG